MASIQIKTCLKFNEQQNTNQNHGRYCFPAIRMSRMRGPSLVVGVDELAPSTGGNMK